VCWGEGGVGEIATSDGGEEHVLTLVVYGRRVDKKLSLNVVERC